ncbi:unnamed protein product [Caenorhabditis angaria]|uniref:Tyrosine-protein kinase n=1 Tax=Caenorhabditis angaria TaxID=860376 RepID=A0A9P1I686_9PELO|nr:unnamed protein product [Caenorhabditis angaria]
MITSHSPGSRGITNKLNDVQMERSEMAPGPDLMVTAEDEKSKSTSKSIEETKDAKTAIPGAVTAPNLSNASENKGASASQNARIIRKLKLRKIANWTGCNGAQLDDEPFYHGYMSRDEAERLMKNQGDFLLRKTEIQKRGNCICVTVLWDNNCYHMIIERAKSGLFYLKDFCFENMSDLIRYHQQNRVEIYHTGIKLISWVVREEWQLYHEQISLGKKLGNGEFGEVFQGVLSVGVFTKDVDVAIKTMKGENVTADEKITFLREANLMLKLHHKNVVRLYGVATQKEPIMIVMECCSGGSLRGRLDKNFDELSEETQRKFAKQIAKGMRYLEEKQVIHRDLAARNCLLDKNDTCKISDFGLSLLGKSHKERKLLKVPVRWLAPETLSKGIYSSKSDVWSFGVVCFEIFSGKYPYDEIKVLKEVRKQILEHGLRLRPPEKIPKFDADLMLMCFDKVETRPTFEEICEKYKEVSHGISFGSIAQKFGFNKNN